MDRFESISAFVAVAKAGGFSAAGRRLGVPLATMSRRVAELEADLGARLLLRSTRQVVLTEAGQSFFSTCERLLAELEEAEQTVTGEYRSPKGELAITAPVGFGRLHVQPLAIDFLAAYPEINLRLHLVDRLVDIVEEHVDLAVRIAELKDSSLIAKPLGHIRMVVTASPAYLERRGTPRHPSELLRHDCIGWATLGPLSAWRLRADDMDQTFPIQARLWTNTPESAIAAADAGLGLLQTGCYLVEQGIREGRLVQVLRDFECAATPVSLVYASNRLVPLKLRAFIDYVAPRLAERLRSIAATVGPNLP